MNKISVLLVLLAVTLQALHAQTPHPAARSGSGTDLVPPTFEPQVTIRTENGKRIIDSNGIPNHDVGRFPRRENPNAIAPQKYHFEVSLQPKAAERTVLAMGHAYGIAVNGVVFDPGTAEFWQNNRDSGWHYEAGTGKLDLGLDANQAHVQPSGAYHYHAIPLGLLKRLNPENKPQLVLVGYAADGFPIYSRWDHSDAKDANSGVRVMHSSYRVKQGTRPGGPGGAFDGTFTEDFEYIAGSGDLDECGGRFGVTPENPEGIYHYVLTDDYPFIPRLYKGTPDASFLRRGPPPGGGPGGRRGSPGRFPPLGFPPPPR